MHSIVNKESFTEQQLSEIVEKNPYYHLGHFRLLANLSNSKSNVFEKQACKTALFFFNHKWLNHQLHTQNKIKSELHNYIEINEATAFESFTDPKFKLSDKQEMEVETIPFEPLHTVDYFASQGIKITEDPISGDKLGSQLKSFTEWLKSMKKIHPQNISLGDELTDRKIQNIAETSNKNAEIITEAMAEVLIRQDKTDKAIEMYRKLSLNNPAKSAYFAAKIQSLKPQ
jgi:hypothetical protein